MVISKKKNMKEAFNAQKYNKTIKKSKNIMYGGVMGPIDKQKYKNLEAEQNEYEKTLKTLREDLTTASDIYKIYSTKETESFYMYDYAKWLSSKNERITDENISKMVEMENTYNKLNIDSNIYNQVLPKFKELYYKQSWFS
jgi:hypothetical protein